jgi:GNAT superfamily N-acetyltransferase
MSTATIIDALATGRIEAARDIIFEYLACTEGEAGSSVPRGIADLPPPLQAVLTSLAQRHDGPGALLLAMDGDEVVGCVGLSRSDITAPADGLVQRLYVRASHRRHGLARALMNAVHDHARRNGFDRLVLNVMPSRTGAIAFYHRLGYRPMPDVHRWPYPAVWLAFELSP